MEGGKWLENLQDRREREREREHKSVAGSSAKT
jgi:hypothetical protein